MEQQDYRKKAMSIIGHDINFVVNVETMRFVFDGDYNGAVVLSQMLYWHGRTGRDDNGWVFKSYFDWHEEIGLSKYKMRRILNALKKKGVIETKIKKIRGNPTLHYRLLYDEFCKQFKEHVQNSINGVDVVGVDGPEKKPSKKFADDSIEHQISRHLFNQIRKLKPDFKEPNWDTWDSVADKMMRLDKRKPDTIWAVVNWCTEDHFWQNIVLSVSNLRKNFDKLELKMKQKPAAAKKPWNIIAEEESQRNIDAAMAEYGPAIFGNR